jgi:sugar/nucleoside kinase (ribokinase family)
MALDLLTYGEALVEMMRDIPDVPFSQSGTFIGPFPSGAPFIFAVQAARLGAQVGVVGCVGGTVDGVPDGFAECLLNQLKTDGVETGGVLTQAGYATGVAFISYESNGDRDFIFHLRQAAAGQLSPELLTLPQVERLFDGLRCLHIMGSSLSIHDDALALGVAMLERAKSQGVRISFDPNLRPQLMSVDKARTVFAPFLAAADVLIPTADELIQLTHTQTLDDALASLHAMNPNCIVVLTQGADGCRVYADGDSVDVAGYVVTEVDPTGAGDCFDAGFLTAWLAGKSPVDAARWANACGALAVTQQGPMSGAATTEQVEAFLQTQS